MHHKPTLCNRANSPCTVANSIVAALHQRSFDTELQVFESAIHSAEQRLAHSLRSIMGGDTKEVSHSNFVV